MNDALKIAQSTIAEHGATNLHKRTGVTRDIVEELFLHDVDAYKDVIKFAPKLKGKTIEETCKNIYKFLQSTIQYREDPKPYQFIQYPRRLIRTLIGDCKSLSLFTGAVLKCLNIPYAYRFTKYDEGEYSHVYVVVLLPIGKEIIIDTVYDTFNAEQPYYKKFDKMPEAKIYSLGNTNNVNLSKLSLAQLYIMLFIQRMTAEIQILNKAGKDAGKWATTLNLAKQLLQAINNPNIPVQRKIAELNKLKTNPFLSLLMDRIIAGLNKPFVKWYEKLNAQDKMKANKLFFDMLPRMAGFFMYTYLTDNDAKRFLTAKGYINRAQQMESLQALADNLQVPRDVLLYSMATNFMNQYGMTPQAYIRRKFARNTGVQIGAIDPVTAMALVEQAPDVTQTAEGLITKAGENIKKGWEGIKRLFGKKPDENDVRDKQLPVYDWATLVELAQTGQLSEDNIDLLIRYYNLELSPEQELFVLQEVEKRGVIIPPKSNVPKGITREKIMMLDPDKMRATAQAQTMPSPSGRMRSIKWC